MQLTISSKIHFLPGLVPGLVPVGLVPAGSFFVPAVGGGFFASPAAGFGCAGFLSLVPGGLSAKRNGVV